MAVIFLFIADSSLDMHTKVRDFGDSWPVRMFDDIFLLTEQSTCMGYQNFKFLMPDHLVLHLV